MKYYREPGRQIDVLKLKKSINPGDFYISEGHVIDTRNNSKWRLGGLCPFHTDKKTGSFYINLENGAFCCFSCNSKGGDLISFVQMKYSLSFKEAIQKLVNEWRLYER
jgi:DNA primase